jgi:hypothetical protein
MTNQLIPGSPLKLVAGELESTGEDLKKMVLLRFYWSRR